MGSSERVTVERMGHVVPLFMLAAVPSSACRMSSGQHGSGMAVAVVAAQHTYVTALTCNSTQLGVCREHLSLDNSALGFSWSSQ